MFDWIIFFFLPLPTRSCKKKNSVNLQSSLWRQPCGRREKDYWPLIVDYILGVFIFCITGTTSIQKGSDGVVSGAKPFVGVFVCFTAENGRNVEVLFSVLHDSGMEFQMKSVKARALKDKNAQLLNILTAVVRVSS